MDLFLQKHGNKCQWTSHFRGAGTGSLLKSGGVLMDLSLFMDRQLGTGDRGLCVCRLKTQGDKKTISIDSFFCGVNACEGGVHG